MSPVQTTSPAVRYPWFGREDMHANEKVLSNFQYTAQQLIAIIGTAGQQGLTLAELQDEITELALDILALENTIGTAAGSLLAASPNPAFGDAGGYTFEYAGPSTSPQVIADGAAKITVTFTPRTTKVLITVPIYSLVVAAASLTGASFCWMNGATQVGAAPFFTEFTNGGLGTQVVFAQELDDLTAGTPVTLDLAVIWPGGTAEITIDWSRAAAPADISVFDAGT